MLACCYSQARTRYCHGYLGNRGDGNLQRGDFPPAQDHTHHHTHHRATGGCGGTGNHRAADS